MTLPPLRTLKATLVLLAPSFASSLFMPWTALTQPDDPTTVRFSKSCASQVLEVQIWNRIQYRWDSHPEHPYILSESCQIEDAGYLMNEIRVRCLRTDARTLEPWTEGVRVYDPGVIDRCTLPKSRKPVLQIESPAKGEIIRNETQLVHVKGRTIFETIQKNRPQSLIAAKLFQQLQETLPEIKSALVENLTTGDDAIEVAFQPSGEFEALVGLRTGENLIRVRITDENGQVGSEEILVIFDISLLRQKWLQAERERIQRFRKNKVSGQVDVEVLDP